MPGKTTRTIKKFNRLNDRFFKYLFANPVYKFLLIAFLNEVLADVPEGAERLAPIVDLEYADREFSPTYQDDKAPRFDVLATTEDGRILHIEVQLERDPNLLPRVLHYATREFFICTHMGRDYADVQVICVVILDFTFFHETPAFHTLHRILNVEDGSWQMRGLEFHFIEMPKLRKRRSLPRTGLERMLYFLGSMGGEEKMRAIASEDPRVAKMMELEKIFRSDPGFVRRYLSERQEEFYQQEKLRRVETEGEARGEKRGKREGILSTLSALVQKGLLTLKDAAAQAGMTEKKFLAQVRALQ